MTALPVRLGLLLASTAAVSGLTVLVPATASAATPPAAASPAAWPVRCTPEHTGRTWRWHDTRRGGHWDHLVWNRWQRRPVWEHEWRDDRYCDRRDNRGWGDHRDGDRGGNRGWDDHRNGDRPPTTGTGGRDGRP